MKLRALLSVALLAVATSAFAQNPTTVTVPASSDHNTVIGASQVLTGYNVFIVKKTAPTVRLDTKSIGKPAPDAANAGFLVAVPIPASFLTQKNVELQVGYEAFGPGGTSPSPVLSDPFAFLGAPTVSATAKPSVQ
jgi:hypothetical protein